MAEKTSVPLKDFERFQKLLAVAFSSDQPGEVMAAITVAKALMAKHKITWDGLWKKYVTVEALDDYEEVQPQPRPGPNPRPQARPAQGARPTPDQIDEAFRTVMDNLWPNSEFSTFVHSIHEQWERKHWLSDAQLRALFNARNNARART